MANKKNKSFLLDISLNDNATNGLQKIESSLGVIQQLLARVNQLMVTMGGLNLGAKLNQGGDFDKRTKQYKQLQSVVSSAYKESEKVVSSLVEKEVGGKEKVYGATVRIANAQAKVNNHIKKTNNSTTAWLKRLKNTFFSIYAFRKIINVFNSVVKVSSAWVENLNLFETAFGTLADESLDYLTEFAQKMGLSNNQVVKVASNFKELANTVGLLDDVSSRASIALTQLGYDIASLRNLDFEKIFEKLQSTIFGGQVKTARTLGINVSAEGLTELLEQLGVTNVAFRNLSESDKVLLRMIATFKQLGSEGADTFGDLGDTITSLANRIRVFQGSWENLKQAIGDLFSDTLSEVVAWASGFIQALTSIIRAFKPLQKESGFNELANGLENVTDATEELESTMGLLDIDRFSVLGSGGANGNSSLSSILNEELSKQLDIYNQQTETLSKYDKKVQEVKNSIIQWLFPLSKVNEETGEIDINTSKLNDTLLAMVSAIKLIVSLAIAKKISTIGIGVGKLILWLKKLGVSLKNVSIGFVSLTLGIYSALEILLNPDLSSGQKLLSFIIALTSAVTALAVAFFATHNWVKALSVAGIVGASALGVMATISSATQFEKGGIPKQGSLYFAGEGKGAELLGNVGGRTNVINEGQLGQVLYNAVKRANDDTRVAGGGDMKVVLEVNGKELAKNTFNDFNYIGKLNTGKEWGGK